MVSMNRLLGLAWLLLPMFAQANSVPSPAADHDLICNPEDITDCYPRVFNPTADFQPIREGQDIPPGLHVRMDIYSGIREARLNIPLEGEEASALEAALDGLPVEQSVVLVDQPSSEETALSYQVPIKPPAYENAGKIMPPRPVDESDDSDDSRDSRNFPLNLATVRGGPGDLDSSLSSLSDISHDIYYGLQIVKDGPVMEKLMCHLLSSSPSTNQAHSQKASSIIASSLQNNPTALNEVSKWSKTLFSPTCDVPLHSANIVTTLHHHLSSSPPSAPVLKAQVSALSGLMRDTTFRDLWLQNKGMQYLHAIFLTEGNEYDVVRQKVGQLIMDNFLDEELGAVTGIWPKGSEKGKVTDEYCMTSQALDDGCWETHVKAYGMQKGGKLSWVKRFKGLLSEARDNEDDVAAKTEL